MGVTGELGSISGDILRYGRGTDNVEADSALGIDVGVVDPGLEHDLRSTSPSALSPNRALHE